VDHRPDRVDGIRDQRSALFAAAGSSALLSGFGSQALWCAISWPVHFFLFDDAFRKGEYLDVGRVLKGP